MKRQGQHLFPNDSRKSLLLDSKRSQESRLTPIKSSFEQSKERKLFTQISLKEQWITSFNSSIKTIDNMKKHYAILIKYKKTNESKVLEQILRRKVRCQSFQVWIPQLLNPTNSIRRRSCYCENCGIQSKKLKTLNEKCPKTIIMNDLPKEKKRRRYKDKRPTQLKTKDKNENMQQSKFDSHAKYILTKYGVINLLPIYQIQRYLKKSIKFIKKEGSVDDLEVNYQIEDKSKQQEQIDVISMSKLDFIKKREVEENKKLLNRRRLLDMAKFSEESDTELDSACPSLKKSINKIQSKKNLIFQLNEIDQQKSKMELVLKNVLQRNRLTINTTMNKFIDKKNLKSSNTTNDTGKYFSFLSLHQMHRTSLKQKKNQKTSKNQFFVKKTLNFPYCQQAKQLNENSHGKLNQKNYSSPLKKQKFQIQIPSLQLYHSSTNILGRIYSNGVSKSFKLPRPIEIARQLKTIS